MIQFSHVLYTFDLIQSLLMLSKTFIKSYTFLITLIARINIFLVLEKLRSQYCYLITIHTPYVLNFNFQLECWSFQPELVLTKLMLVPVKAKPGAAQPQLFVWQETVILWVAECFESLTSSVGLWIYTIITHSS